jgi:hypothetical protein
MARVNQYWWGVAEFFGEKGRIFQFLMKNGRKCSDFVEQKKTIFCKIWGGECSTPDTPPPDRATPER